MDTLDAIQPRVIVRELHDGRIGLVVVGAETEFLADFVATHLIALLAFGFSPAESLLLADQDVRAERRPRGVRAFVARIDSAEQCLLYAGAGCEATIVARRGGTRRALGANGPALGCGAPDFGENAAFTGARSRLIVAGGPYSSTLALPLTCEPARTRRSLHLQAVV